MTKLTEETKAQRERYFNVLEDIIRTATRSQHYWELAGSHDESPLESLYHELKNAASGAFSQLDHFHQWDRDDRCSICGQDGRA